MSIDPKQLLKGLREENSDRSELGDRCSQCGVDYSFDEIGFRGICYDCKPAIKLEKNIIDKVYEKLLAEDRENVVLSGKSQKHTKSSKDSK